MAMTMRPSYLDVKALVRLSLRMSVSRLWMRVTLLLLLVTALGRLSTTIMPRVRPPPSSTLTQMWQCVGHVWFITWHSEMLTPWHSEDRGRPAWPVGHTGSSCLPTASLPQTRPCHLVILTLSHDEDMSPPAQVCWSSLLGACQCCLGPPSSTKVE